MDTDNGIYPRQRLMYMQLASPNPTSECVACTIFEPVKGFRPEIESGEVDVPYSNVIDALADGWKVIQLPDPRAAFDDHDLDVIGYEFVLQKMEIIDED